MATSGLRVRSRRRLSLVELPLGFTLSYCQRRSPSDSITTTSTSLARNLRNCILTSARHHLRDYAIIQQVTAERFAPFLPQESDSSDTVALFHRGMTAPILVSDGELQQILDLEPADQLDLRQSYCYFRSWTMEKQQLEQIMQSIRQEGYFYPEFSTWDFLIRGLANNAIVTPRYVGTTSREDPRKRSTYFNRGTSLVEKFDAKSSQLFPALSRKISMFLIKKSALFYADVRLAAQNDLYEGWMVSFFGSASLLNRQRGGINPSIIPFHEDVCTFLRCNTTLLAKLKQTIFYKDDKLAKEVRSLYRPLEELIYDITRKTLHYHKICDYVDHISQQATPHQAYQYTLLVFCGLQTTKTSIDEGRGFFDGSSESGHLSKMILQVFATWENKPLDTHFQDLQRVLNFNNLYHWTGSDITKDGKSVYLFHQWLQTVRPLIIVTYGKDVVQIINKRAENTRIDNLIRAAGRAQVLDKDSPKEAILIPLLHPGFSRRTQQSPVQRRVLFLTYMAVWVYLDAALELIRGTCDTSSIRHELCQSIMDFAERKLRGANFYEALDSASEQLLAETKNAHPISHKSKDWPDYISSNLLRPFQPGTENIPDEIEAKFSNCASHMRVFFEEAARNFHIGQGEPHSRERQRQVKSLYSQKVPGLVTYLDMSNQRNWVGFLEMQPTDCPLIACVEALEPPSGMPSAKLALLQQYGCNTVESFECRRAALSAICADFLSRQVEWTKWMKRRGPEKHLLDVEDQRLQKFPVHVSLSGTLTIHGEVAGISRTVRIKSKAIATKTWLDQRIAEFHLDRLNVLDGNDNLLHSVKRSFERVTIMLADTRRLSAQDNKLQVDGHGFGMKTISNRKPGRPPLKQHQIGANCQNSPPHPNDALWLLNKFINERFPEGGMFWTGDPGVFVKSSGDYQAFKAFLKQHENLDHPWSDEWLNILNKPKGLITLSTSLKWLREVVVLVQNAPMSMPRDGRAFRARCSVYELGPRKDGW